MPARPQANPSNASASTPDAFCRCLRHKRSGPSLPLSSMNESDDLARGHSFLPLSLRVQFLPLSTERTAGSFAIDGRPLELPPLLLLRSASSVVAAAAVCSFRRCRCCRPQLPSLPLLLSAVSIIVAVAVRIFHRRRRHRCPQLPLLPFAALP